MEGIRRKERKKKKKERKKERKKKGGEGKKERDRQGVEAMCVITSPRFFFFGLLLLGKGRSWEKMAE